MIGLGEVVGKLSADGAARLGLREGTPVAQGGADAFVGMGKRSAMAMRNALEAVTVGVYCSLCMPSPLVGGTGAAGPCDV